MCADARRFFAIIGSAALFAPLIGFYVTVNSMIRGFDRLSSANAAGNTHAVSSMVDNSLFVPLLTYAISGLGLALIGIAMLAFHFRPSWLISTLKSGLLFWLIVFPFGTVFALVVLQRLKRLPRQA